MFTTQHALSQCCSSAVCEGMRSLSACVCCHTTAQMESSQATLLEDSLAFYVKGMQQDTWMIVVSKTGSMYADPTSLKKLK